MSHIALFDYLRYFQKSFTGVLEIDLRHNQSFNLIISNILYQAQTTFKLDNLWNM